MVKGETREFYIHPTLAYDCDLDDLSINEGCYLKAIVTLHEIHNEIPVLQLKPSNLDFLFDPGVMKRTEENYQNALRVKGATIASHLMKSKEVDLSKVRDHLSRLYINDVTTTKQEEDLINHINWNIYFN